VAETRSFAKTARLSGVSPSAVAKRIARLEERLNVTLLHRSTRSITLTAEGGLLLARSRRILEEAQGAEDDLTSAANAARGRLRLSIPFVGRLLLPVLADFMLRHPAIELDLDLSDRLVNVVEEGFDAVIRTGEPPSSGLTARILGSWPMVLVAAPSYLDARGTPLQPADLASHSCLHHRFSGTGKIEPWLLDWPTDAPETAIPVSMVANSLEARIAFAERGLGIAYLPEFTVMDSLAAGELKVVLPAFTRKNLVTFRIFWAAGRHASPKVRALVDFLVKALRA